MKPSCPRLKAISDYNSGTEYQLWRKSTVTCRPIARQRTQQKNVLQSVFYVVRAMSIAKKRSCKHVSLTGVSPEIRADEFRHPYGNGVRYLHRDPASRRRRQRGSLKSETVKYDHESQETRTRERLRWRGPAAYTRDIPVLSSEWVPHKNKTVTD
jgi:hypothetical protein